MYFEKKNLLTHLVLQVGVVEPRALTLSVKTDSFLHLKENIGLEFNEIAINNIIERVTAINE